MAPSPRQLAPRSQQAAASIVLPRLEQGPVRSVSRRLVIAVLAMLAVATLVWLDRDGYRDVDDRLTFLDAVYYASVSLSTTGYGDITPVSDGARLVNILVITPLRVLFLIVLVGTTVEVLTERTREHFRQNRWRASLKQHTVVVGYGTKGRSAVRALLDDGINKEQVVVVDNDADHVAHAHDDGITAINGDGTRSDVLRLAEIESASRVIVALPRDDAAVLVTLTARRFNPQAYIVATVRESENAALLRDGGADGVVVSSEAAGRLLGVASSSPSLGAIFEDLLVPGKGLELIERPVRPDEVGLPTRDVHDLVVAVVRGGESHTLDAVTSMKIEKGDGVVVVRASGVPHTPLTDL